MVLHLAVAMLLGIGSAGAQQNASTVEALRERLLGEKSRMNPAVPPSTSSGQGTQVWVQFRVFKVLQHGQSAPLAVPPARLLRLLRVWCSALPGRGARERSAPPMSPPLTIQVLDVDLESGRLRFKAWRRTRWFDNRLTWDPVSVAAKTSQHQPAHHSACIVRRSLIK